MGANATPKSKKSGKLGRSYISDTGKSTTAKTDVSSSIKNNNDLKSLQNSNINVS